MLSLRLCSLVLGSSLVLTGCPLSDYEVAANGSGAAGSGASASGGTGNVGVGGSGAGSTGGVGNSGGSPMGGGGAGGTLAGGGGDGGTGGTGVYPCDQPNEVRGGPQNHCYFHDPDGVMFTVAEAACQTWGGELASVNTEVEYNFIVAQFPAHDYWVGLTELNPADTVFEYQWADGTMLPAEGSGSWSAPLGLGWKSGDPKLTEPCTKMHDGFESKACDHAPGQGHVCERP